MCFSGLIKNMNKIKYFFKKIINYIRLKRLERSRLVIMCVFALGVAVGGHFFAYAENFIDSFLDTSRVANTWNVEVDTANGEVKLAQRSCDNTVWFCDMAWRCSGTAGDGGQLLVRRTDIGTRQWKIWNNACDTPQCGQDGAQSGDNLAVDSTIDLNAHYPAQQACKDIGGRLPTAAEMQCITTYRSLFGNNFNTGHYWTSEESGNAGYARYVYVYYNRIEEYYKTESRYVRCVRGW